MPDLTTQQIKFLSKYLKVVPKTGRLRSQKKHDKALAFNDLVKLNFANYEAKKKEADALAAEVKTAIDELKQLMGAVSEHQGGKAMASFREALGNADNTAVSLTQSISAKHVEVMNAPEKKPAFGTGETALTEIITGLKKCKADLPTPPRLLNDGIAGALYSARAKIAPLRSFEKHAFMTVNLSEAPLPDQAADKIRETNRKRHIELCRKAYTDFNALINPVLNHKSDLTAESAARDSEKLLSDLLSAREAPINLMMEVIKANAKGKIDDLAQGGNKVAARENKRSKQIADKLQALVKQQEALASTVENLHAAIGEATGFKEKQAAVQAYEDALKRLGSMGEYIDQLGAYDNDLALKVDRITRAEEEYQKGQSMLADPQGYLDAAGDKVGKMEGDKVDILLLGAPDETGQNVAGVYDNLLAKFTTAVNRVTVDVKLFPGEDDLTDISKDQFRTLKAMIDAAKVIAESGKKLLDEAQKISSRKQAEKAQKLDEAAVIFGKAKFIFDDADRMYTVFNNSNKFPLPDAPEKAIDDKERIAKRLQTAAVELDRFWGIGGDEDNTVRNLLGRAGDAFETASKPGGSNVFLDTEDLLSQFQDALDTARKAFNPKALSDKDKAAKDRAAKAHGLFVDALSELYTTKKLQESEIGDIPADHLLIVEKGGKKEYFEILTKGNGDEINKRDDKKIPRESINLLLEQATMLELLAESDAPGMGDVVEAAVKKSMEQLKGITEGGPTFEKIKKIISDCDKLLTKSTLTKWVPANLQATKVNFETFKTEYPTKYLPDVGETKAKAFQTAIEKLIEDSDKVRVAYTEADAFMVQLEKDFANTKGADKNNLTTRLAEIIKAGPNGLSGGYAAKPGEEAEVAELLAKMQASFTELTDISDKASIDGPLKPRVKSARQTIDTKSADGIRNGLAEARKIRTEMEAALGKLDPTKGLQYLKDLAAFLSEQATAATEAKDNLKKMEDTKLEVKTKLAEASDILKTESKKTLKTYKEYKTLYDSLKTQYETAKKGFEKEKVAKDALKEYESLLPNAKQLAKDLGNIKVIWEPGQKAVNFAKFQTTLETKIQSVRDGALAAAQKLLDEAAEDIPQDGAKTPEIITLEEAVAAAAKTLELAGADAISKLVVIDGGLQAEADKALKITDKDKRLKALQTTREAALAEVRRIRTQTEKHPALKIYRDNPFVKDVSWPAFAATLHELDVQVLTTLRPR